MTMDKRIAAIAASALALAACQAQPATTTTAPAPTVTVTTAKPSTTAPATSAPATSSTAPASTTAATTQAPTTQAPTTQPPAASGSTACMKQAGLCFESPAGVDIVDTSKAKNADGAWTDELRWSKTGLGPIATVSATNTGGIGGVCPPGSRGNARITRVEKTKATGIKGDGTYNVPDMYAVQYLMPDGDGTWQAVTTLTTTKAALTIGDLDACKLAFATFSTFNNGGVFRASTGPDGPPTMTTLEKAQAVLAGEAHQIAFQVFATARNAP